MNYNVRKANVKRGISKVFTYAFRKGQTESEIPKSWRLEQVSPQQINTAPDFWRKATSKRKGYWRRISQTWCWLQNSALEIIMCHVIGLFLSWTCRACWRFSQEFLWAARTLLWSGLSHTLIRILNREQKRFPYSPADREQRPYHLPILSRFRQLWERNRMHL